MSRLRNFIQHRLNAVHVYCRLCDCRIPKRAARLISAAWEACYTRPRLALAGLAVLAVLASCAPPAQARHQDKQHRVIVTSGLPIGIWTIIPEACAQ